MNQKAIGLTLTGLLLVLVWLLSGQPMNVTVTVKYADGTPAKDVTVIVTDFLSGKTTVEVTDENGVAKFSIPNFDKAWFGKKAGDPDWDKVVAYDVNYNGIIDLSDMVIFSKKFGYDTAVIGTVRVIVPPAYDKTQNVSASPYPEQNFTFTDVPSPVAPPAVAVPWWETLLQYKSYVLIGFVTIFVVAVVIVQRFRKPGGE